MRCSNACGMWSFSARLGPRAGIDKLTLDGGHLLYGSRKATACAGVAIALHSKHKACVQQVRVLCVLDDSLMYFYLKNGTHTIRFVSVYMPHAGYPIDDLRCMYEQLQFVLEDARRRGFAYSWSGEPVSHTYTDSRAYHKRTKGRRAAASGTAHDAGVPIHDARRIEVVCNGTLPGAVVRTAASRNRRQLIYLPRARRLRQAVPPRVWARGRRRNWSRQAALLPRRQHSAQVQPGCSGGVASLLLLRAAGACNHLPQAAAAR